MNVSESASLQQTNWQKIADKKQQKLQDATKSGEETLKRVREEQLEIYSQKGKRLEVQQSNRVNVRV